MPSTSLIGSEFFAFFGRDNRGAQSLLRTNESCILDPNLLGKLVRKQGNFNPGILEPPQSFSGDSLIGIQNANKHFFDLMLVY